MVGHLMRMNERRPARRILKATITKNMKMGRPRQSWKLTVVAILEHKGLTWNCAINYTD